MSKFSFWLIPVIFSIIIFSKVHQTGNNRKAGISAMDESFLMPVEDVSTLTGRGTIVNGRIERGIIKTGDSVEIAGFSNLIIKSKVTGIAVFHKLQEKAGRGENAGLLLSGIEKSQIKRGMVICKPGSITVHTEFIGEFTLLKSEASSIIKHISITDSLQFYFRTAVISGVILLPPGKELQSATTVTATVVLSTPIAMEKDMKFGFERGEITGSGKVTATIK